MMTQEVHQRQFLLTHQIILKLYEANSIDSIDDGASVMNGLRLCVHGCSLGALNSLFPLFECFALFIYWKMLKILDFLMTLFHISETTSAKLQVSTDIPMSEMEVKT